MEIRLKTVKNVEKPAQNDQICRNTVKKLPEMSKNSQKREKMSKNRKNVEKMTKISKNSQKTFKFVEKQ